MYGHPVDFGISTVAKNRRTPVHTKTVAEVHKTPVRVAAYGIFEGQGGPTAARLCARNFVPTLLEDSSLKRDPDIAIRNSCRAVEAYVMAKSALDNAHYGTTMLITTIIGNDIFIANIGNSRGILATEDDVQVLTRDHELSKARKVPRIRNGGSFFQDGKTHNPIQVISSIDSSEVKSRKHGTFPNRKMTDDIVFAKPDIYYRALTPRDRFLVMATAEVWAYLSDHVVEQIVSDSLRRDYSSHICAKKVAVAAIQAGALGPVSVIILLCPAARTKGEKYNPHPRQRTSGKSHAKRHGLNAEQQLQCADNEWKRVNTTAFVETEQSGEENVVQSSPIASPVISILRSPSSLSRQELSTIAEGTSCSIPLISADVLPTSEKVAETKHSAPHVQTRFKSDDLMVEQESRKQISFELLPGREMAAFAEKKVRKIAGLKRDRPRAKTALVSQISEVTVSGATGEDCSSQTSFGAAFPAVDDFAEYNTNTSSKVRYREDGSIDSGRVRFLREFRKPFFRRR